MSFVVQNDEGNAAGANSYCSVADFRAYHEARGTVLEIDDEVITAALVKATDHVDLRFTYIGRRRNGSDVQQTQWPRSNVWDPDGRLVLGVPVPIKHATAEYALRAISKPDLMPDPSNVAPVLEESSEVGPLKTSVKYGGQGEQPIARYPKADALIARAGLAITGRAIVRA